jgi:uroporphyrinogen decarboxylase
MTPKENARRIIKFDSPEYVMGGPPVHSIKYRGNDHAGYEGGGHDCPVGTEWTDIWGVGWRKVAERVMGFHTGHPIAKPEDLKAFTPPDPDDERVCGLIYQMAEEFKNDPDREQKFLGSRHRETLLEKANTLMGMEQLFIAFKTEPGFVKDVFRMVMDFHLGVAKHYAEVGVEYAGLGDDLGTQIGPLVGPDLLEEFFVPEYRRLFDFYKERGVLIGFHSCGCIEAVLDMLMDLGVDVLNPVQATANDHATVRAKTQGRMALQGGVSTAVIMDGPPERIVEEVRKEMWLLGREGGYFCGPDQGMPFPESHLAAVHNAVEQYGKYPLRPPERHAPSSAD